MPRLDPKSIAGKDLLLEERTELLIVGAGPAGLAAAICAAGHGLSVMLVDENPVPFETMGDEVPLHYGQGMTGAVRNRNAMVEALVASEPQLEAAFEAGVDVRLGTACWGLYGKGPGSEWTSPAVAGLDDGDRSWLIGANHVIAAAGRRDMGLGFAGWHKAGVMGATAAVTLSQRYGALEPRRVVVLGSSTEALLAARVMQDAGVEIAAVVDHVERPLGSPGLVSALRGGGCEFLMRHVAREAVGGERVEAALVCPLDEDGRPGNERRIACDGIVLGVGVTAVIDLLDAAGCEIAFQPERSGYAPVLDSGQRTTRPNVFAVGDCAGIWTAKTLDRSVAEAEGRRAVAAILAESGAGKGVAGSDQIPPDTPDHDISAYRQAWVRASIVEARAEFPICQCEEVTAREILEVRPPRYLDWQAEKRNERSLASMLGDGPPNPDQVKRLTRAGMGPCQGRRCREQVAALLALEAAVPLSSIPLARYRAPVRPLPLASASKIPEAPEQAEHWDTWFGIPAQWRPFWEVPEFYRTATAGTATTVASE